MKYLALISAIGLFVGLTDGAIGSDDESSLITTKCPPRQHRDARLRQWRQLPARVRRKIEKTIVTDLGLSSTGNIELIGVYNHPDGDNQKAKRLFHLRQADLFGDRLFWSVLVDAEKGSYRVLFHIRESGDDMTTWKKLRD